ncbi:hypothetical protein IP86_12430 [Rhodopseudomonas sp. AAP120]|uniref:DUF6602 domain-containing protein n=1 Tax=Rhodopseudomonas sp. AAP120 TaxID=1523430 RepID=UPI0006B8C794|nr:DUF6602 domain-containing protein [Rhodopseudomonas sp. AAP120]KPF98134.1 hypothetical protein IP86_12430 [Rhodopseudomonas sp. AAP120]
MDESLKGLRVREFFQIESKTLLERYRIIETLLPHATARGAAHRGEEGRHIESLLRSFLNKHLPKNLRAVSGFVLCPSTKTGVQNLDRVTEYHDRHSRQIDIIVFDFDAYPVFEQFEEFCIVPPEGVVGIISVKKKLYNKDIANEMAALKQAADLCFQKGRRGPYTGLFAFSADEESDSALTHSIFAFIKKVHEGQRFDAMLNEASVLARTCVFKNRLEHGRNNSAKYIAVDCRTEPHIPLQRLIQSILSVYYDKTRGSGKERPGFASFRKRTFAESPELGLVAYSNSIS